MRSIVMTALFAAFCTGCTYGPKRLDEVAMARGRTVLIELARSEAPNRLQGELILVQDSTMLLATEVVYAIPFSAVRKLSVQGRVPNLNRDAAQLYARGRPGAYLGTLSRFPYGASPEVVQQVLESYRQEQPRRLTR